MSSPSALESGRIYHVYNRGNNGEAVFRDRRASAGFLQLCARYLPACFDIYAFCLMGNHFHFLLRVVTEPEWRARMLLTDEVEPCQEFDPSRRLADVFSTHAKRTNGTHDRTGSLFEKPFRRKVISSPGYLAAAVRYIHRNPQNHEFTDDFASWPWSSYALLMGERPSPLQRDEVMSWFGGRDNFAQFHTRHSPLSGAATEADLPDRLL